jgi:hypothetical protein
MKYPILDKNSKKTTYPLTGECPVCGGKFKEKGFAFFSAGSLLIDKKGDMVISKNARMESYLSVGFHGPENFGASEGHYETYVSMRIVDFPKQGEFEFNFCSIKCMRDWFNTIFDDLQEEVHACQLEISLLENAESPLQIEEK